jgi:hypothetical protein
VGICFEFDSFSILDQGNYMYKNRNALSLKIQLNQIFSAAAQSAIFWWLAKFLAAAAQGIFGWLADYLWSIIKQ